MVIRMKPIELSVEDERLVGQFAALGNPARFRILEILSRNPESIVANIVDELPLAQATVSQHLRVLQDAGLIYGDRASGGRCCQIDVAAVSRLAQQVVGWSLALLSGTCGTAETKGAEWTR
jgi:ArsR family transcriptional regulator